ncbi:hypothetical protein J6590_034902 [Homalodisca vitripennis]|nr:hypothetical protein J6590_034902 [Homalodisca vitripennis]
MNEDLGRGPRTRPRHRTSPAPLILARAVPGVGAVRQPCLYKHYPTPYHLLIALCSLGSMSRSNYESGRQSTHTSLFLTK